MIDTISIILLCIFLLGSFILTNYCRFLKHKIKDSQSSNKEFDEEEIYSAVETLLEQLKELEDKNDKTKQHLLESASDKGYKIVYLMLQTQPEQMLAENVRVARERSNYVNLDELKQEIVQNLQERFKFNAELSEKFAEVIIDVVAT